MMITHEGACSFLLLARWQGSSLGCAMCAEQWMYEYDATEDIDAEVITRNCTLDLVVYQTQYLVAHDVAR